MSVSFLTGYRVLKPFKNAHCFISRTIKRYSITFIYSKVLLFCLLRLLLMLPLCCCLPLRYFKSHHKQPLVTVRPGRNLASSYPMRPLHFSLYTANGVGSLNSSERILSNRHPQHCSYIIIVSALRKMTILLDTTTGCVLLSRVLICAFFAFLPFLLFTSSFFLSGSSGRQVEPANFEQPCSTTNRT